MSDIPRAVRAAVKGRERGLCLNCSSGRASQIHHRLRRREGGHALSVCILVCATCHYEAHHNVAWARRRGLIVPTYADPLVVPVKSWRGWMVLDDGGDLRFLDENVEDALEWALAQA